MTTNSYDQAKEQYFSARQRERSPIASARSFLARNRMLRRIFDATYAGAYLRFFSQRTIKHHMARYLDPYPNVLFSRTGTGFSHNAELRVLDRFGAVRQKDILLIGIEYGSEIDIPWTRYEPHSIVGIDIGEYEQAGRNRPAGRVPVKFLKMDASNLGFAPESFDLVYSEGVMPHVIDVPGFVEHASQVLRPDGIFYAFCCPLWRTYGGSHIHTAGYDHLRLPPSALIDRAKSQHDGSYWWLEKGLFNRMRFRELFQVLEDRFEVLRIGIVEAPDGRKYRARYPNEWAALRGDFEEEDLLIRLVSFAARKR